MLLSEKKQKFKQLVERLLNRCQEIQTENERCVIRVNTIKKLIRRRVQDVELLKKCLDRHNDIWRSLPMVAPHPKRKIEQKRGPKPKNKDLCNQQKEKKVRKQRMKKTNDELVKTPDTNNINQTFNLPQKIEETQLYESHAQQLLMMQQRQINLKNQFF
uniref:INO80 complex subunit F domain-containing protein n=1 Tax=Glossina brevipalpis TaxID=37001 RepID=A0A1A9WEL6_9MUSC